LIPWGCEDETSRHAGHTELEDENNFIDHSKSSAFLVEECEL